MNCTNCNNEMEMPHSVRAGQDLCEDCKDWTPSRNYNLNRDLNANSWKFEIELEALCLKHNCEYETESFGLDRASIQHIQKMGW